MNDDVVVVDSRFKSFRRCFIIDILKSDSTKYQKYKVVKMNNRDYVSRVCISGLVVGVYELDKIYRCKLDDSTGRINVTIWKEQVLTPQSNQQQVASNNEKTINDTVFGVDDDDSIENEKSDEIQNLFQSIRNRTNDSRFNNFLQNRPVNGDYLSIRGTIKNYKNIVEINAVSSIKIKTSSEEYIEMFMPMYLNDKCYSLIDLSKISSSDIQNRNNKIDNNKAVDEKIVNLVFTKLKDLTSNSRKPCNSFMLLKSIRDDNHAEYKSITSKDVFNALKHLEIKSLVYSCENEFTFLPII